MVTIIDRGRSLEEATWLLAHEVAHAIQDEQFGLAGIVEGTTEDASSLDDWNLN